MMNEITLQIGGHLFLHGTVILGGAWLIIHYASDLPASGKHATWMMAFGVLLLLPMGHSILPGWNLPLPIDSSVATSPSAFSAGDSFPTGSFLNGTAVPSAASGESSMAETSREAAAHSSPSTAARTWTEFTLRASRWIVPGFLLLWAGGALLLLGRLGLGMVTLWRWKRSAADLNCGDLADTLAQQLNLNRSFTVRHSAEAHVPTVWGAIAPTVILPEAAAEWPRSRLKSVLLHELAHIKRRDYLSHLVSRVARALFWLNPLVWVAAERAKAAQEQACDNAVLQSGIASWEYAEQLLAVTKELRQKPAPADTVAIDAGLRFKSRMRALLQSTAPRRPLSRRECVALLLVGTLFLTAASAVQIGSSSERTTQGEQHWLEAESVRLPPAFARRDHDEASRGAYVNVASRADDLDRAPHSKTATYSFETSEADRYLIWARVRVRSDDHDSFWLRVDSTRWIRWNGIEPGEGWHWVQVRDADQDGRPVAFDLSEGRHRLRLGQREDEVDVDQFVVTNDWNYHPGGDSEPVPDEEHHVWLEAEEGWLEAPFHVTNAPDASGWQHLVARSDENSRNVPPASGHASYTFSVPETDTYRLWGRVIAPSSGSNSFWLRVDDGPWIRWNEIREGNQWHWDLAHDADENNQPVRFKLSEGNHQLTLAFREPNVKLDRLLFANNPTHRPRGTGPRPNDAAPVSEMFVPSSADLVSPMVRRPSSESNSSVSLGVPDGPSNDAPSGGPGAATWTFSVPESDRYVLWGEVLAPAENDNSFYVSMDGGEEIAWHTPAPGATTDEWAWDPISSGAESLTDPVIFSLDEGEHQVRIRNREDGTRLRRLRLTTVPAPGPQPVTPDSK